MNDEVRSSAPSGTPDASCTAEAGQAAGRGSFVEAVRRSPKRLLWDAQWVNIVNHDDCWDSYSVTDAVETAVKMAEDAIRGNLLRGEIPDDVRAFIAKATQP